MKEIEESVPVKKFIAEDGTMFDDAALCENYENSCDNERLTKVCLKFFNDDFKIPKKIEWLNSSSKFNFVVEYLGERYSSLKAGIF